VLFLYLSTLQRPVLHSDLSTHRGLDVSELQSPVLHLQVFPVQGLSCPWATVDGHVWTIVACAPPGLMYTTETCAALGPVYTQGLSLTWTCLHCRVLGCTWTSFLYRGLRCTSTCVQYTSIAMANIQLLLHLKKLSLFFSFFLFFTFFSSESGRILFVMPRSHKIFNNLVCFASILIGHLICSLCFDPAKFWTKPIRFCSILRSFRPTRFVFVRSSKVLD
jgi:hypothetical protein